MSFVDDALSFLSDRAKAYLLTFSVSQPENVYVLEDLARFCRANESCVIPGDRDRTLILEGRREVWLRIQQHLHLTPEQLFALYNADYPKISKGTESDKL